MYWRILNQLTNTSPVERQQELLQVLMANRQIEERDQQTFLSPPSPFTLDSESVGLDKTAISKAVSRIIKAIENKETIVIYGDYDADGICATAILWQTLHAAGGQVIPFIPHREHHGYGLSIKGIDDIFTHHDPQLIITVDNGIVAHEGALDIHDRGVDLIITDHHQLSDTLPKAHCIVHSTQICGSGVSWFLAHAVAEHFQTVKPEVKNTVDNSLDLLSIGTIADLMPMTGVNRSLVKHGLSQLSDTKRPGLMALKTEAGITDTKLTSYHVGFIIGPRINAMGRLEHGMDALRLLCTQNKATAQKLAQKLADTNRTRQDITIDSFQVADTLYQQQKSSKIIVIDHQEFHEGIIGLIAGKLTEKYYKPSIVISRGEQISKASARSVHGVNIIELIRHHEDLLLNAGGHPGAAGFSIETVKIDDFRIAINQLALTTITDDLLTPSLTVDCTVSLTDLTQELYQKLTLFEPFGLGNSRPIFTTTAEVIEFKTVGRDQNHLKLRLAAKEDQSLLFEAIAFNLAHNLTLNLGDNVDIVFYLDENEWRGRKNLQLVIKDIHPC